MTLSERMLHFCIANQMIESMYFICRNSAELMSHACNPLKHKLDLRLHLGALCRSGQTAIPYNKDRQYSPVQYTWAICHIPLQASQHHQMSHAWPKQFH